jgi:hypothetical protein
MSTPSIDYARLHNLEENVRTELTLAKLGDQKAETADGPAGEQVPDPDAERYEVRLRLLLGAVEAVEQASRPGPETSGR